MAEFDPLEPIEQFGTLENHSQVRKDVFASAKRRYLGYMALTTTEEVSPAMLAWHGHGMGRSDRASYHLAAGWAYAEAALVESDLSAEERLEILEDAEGHWRAVPSSRKPENIIEKTLVTESHIPTLQWLVAAMAAGEYTVPPSEEQEAYFRGCIDQLLDRWDGGEPDTGLAFELLASYFLHRSNKLRPNEPPLITMISSVRNDYHNDPEMRVDVDCYDIIAGDVYGLQVKSGYIDKNVPPNKRMRRIMLVGARKLLCIPYTERKLWSTLEAIYHDEFTSDLDIIALELREKLKKHLRPQRAARQIKPLRRSAALGWRLSKGE